MLYGHEAARRDAYWSGQETAYEQMLAALEEVESMNDPDRFIRNANDI
jgi:hypothetical protein